MAVRFSRRRSRVDVTDTLLKRARSRSSTRSAAITRACMGRLLMRAGTRLWRTRTPTCRSRVAESLSPHQCIILCDSTAETECTPDIYRVILLRTAAFECQSNTPLLFLMPCRSGLRSLYSAGLQSTATTQANRNRVFRVVHVSVPSWVRVSRRRLRRECGGSESNALLVACPVHQPHELLKSPVRTADATARRCPGRLVVGAGSLGPVRKLDKISQNIKRLVALRID
jgi:hypothetical protein